MNRDPAKLVTSTDDASSPDARAAGRDAPASRAVSTRELFRWLFGFAWPHRKRFLLVFAAMALYAIGSSTRLLLLGVLTDGLVVDQSAGEEPSKFVTLYEWATPESWHLPRVDTQKFDVTDWQVSGSEVLEVQPHSSDGKAQLRLGPGTLSFRDSYGGEYSGANFAELVAKFSSSEGVNLDDESVRSSLSSYRGPALLEVTYGDPGANEGPVPFLIAFAAIGAVLSLVIAGSNFVKQTQAQGVQIRVVAAIRERVFENLSTLDVDFFHSRRSGDLISRLTNDVGSLQATIRYLFGEVLQHPFTIVASLTLAFIASWELALMLLPLLSVIAIPILKSGRKVKREGRGSLRKLGAVTEAMSQLLSGIRVVRAFQMETAQREEFSRRSDHFVESNLRMIRAKATGRSSAEGLYTLLSAVAMLTGAWLLVGDWIPLTFGDFVVFLAAVSQLYQPTKTLTRAYNTIQESRAAAERVLELLDERPKIKDMTGARVLDADWREMEFDRVWFRYDGEGDHEDGDGGWALRDVSFKAHRGQQIALVGHSGAGKSTLLDLVARFYDPTRGQILIDGCELPSLDRSSLLGQIAIVGQDPYLFHTSIEENLRFGRPDATTEEIWRALELAAIRPEIEALPDGLATEIGDRGAKLSGGQRQRLTIARAILKDASILILDEATSALDSASERAVQRALDALVEGRTTFVIAHRLSTVRDSDCILVLDAGRVVESGSHEELVQQAGAYARMLTEQSL